MGISKRFFSTLFVMTYIIRMLLLRNVATINCLDIPSCFLGGIFPYYASVLSKYCVYTSFFVIEEFIFLMSPTPRLVRSLTANLETVVTASLKPSSSGHWLTGFFKNSIHERMTFYCLSQNLSGILVFFPLRSLELYASLFKLVTILAFSSSGKSASKNAIAKGVSEIYHNCRDMASLSALPLEYPDLVKTSTSSRNSISTVAVL